MAELCRSFFDGAAAPDVIHLDEAKFEDKVFILLNWSMGLAHLGIHRPYATYTMLRLWTDARDAAAARVRPIDLFPILYKWLDVAPAAQKGRNVQAIGITFGEFTRAGMFSYSRYLQTLIASGYTVRAGGRMGGKRSHHLDLLSAMPIFVVANDLLQQRRIALSGDEVERREADERAEREAMEAFREECREYVPELYGYSELARRGTGTVLSEC
jgi:mediator of RNA polymerase II transcription subunit 12